MASVLSTALKANMGHLEAAAAAASITSISALPIGIGRVGPNALLRNLNMHLHTLVSSSNAYDAGRNFQVPTELVARACAHVGRPQCPAVSVSDLVRLSSFGFSGTIAHGLFGVATSTRRACIKCDGRSIDVVAVSLVRASLYTVECAAPLTLGLVEQDGAVGSTMETSLECQLPARARLAVKDHVIGRSVVFPGVGYVELAVAQLETGIPTSGEDTVARNVAFMRIWVLAAPTMSLDAPGPCHVRYTHSTNGTFEVASSLSGVSFDYKAHVVGSLERGSCLRGGPASTLREGIGSGLSRSRDLTSA